MLPFSNRKDYRFSQDRRRRFFIVSEPKNSCFTWSIACPATNLSFSPADALFLNVKVHNNSSSLCLRTRKIIGHPGWCKMARRRGQLTLKVEFTGRPLMLYPQKDHNLAIRTPFQLHHPPKRSQLNLVCVHHLFVGVDNISGAGSRLENRVSNYFIFDVYSTTLL